jgi:hypothetical protein
MKTVPTIGGCCTTQNQPILIFVTASAIIEFKENFIENSFSQVSAASNETF